MTPTLELEAATVRLGGRTVLAGVSLALAEGGLIALVGPNGAGKTTLLRALAGLQPLVSGAARLEGQEVGALSPRARARRLAYLPQARPLAWPIRVGDLVALGRFAYGDARRDRLGPRDARAVAAALAAADLAHLAERPTSALSGGERARAHVARALAAETPILLADEPTAALDPSHAHAVLALLAAKAQAGATVLAALHDLSLAARWASRVVVLKEGCVRADGPPAASLAPEVVAEIFAMRAARLPAEQGGGLALLGPV